MHSDFQILTIFSLNLCFYTFFPSFHYENITIEPGQSKIFRLRLTNTPLQSPLEDVDSIIALRKKETDEFYTALQPLKGLGIDISENMIKIAKEKHKETKNIAFNVGKAENLTLNQEFDVILLADIIEHLENVNQMSESLTKIANSKTLIILTMINPLWEPALLIAEKLHMKMPEGPHHRLTFKELEKIFKKHHLYVLDLEYRIFIPKYLPFISDKINSTFFNIPLLRNLGLVQILTLKKV